MEQSVYEFLKDETKKEKERRERELVALKVAEERREGELAALTSEAVRGRVNKNLINFNPNLNILKPKEITPLRPGQIKMIPILGENGRIVYVDAEYSGEIGTEKPQD